MTPSPDTRHTSVPFAAWRKTETHKRLKQIAMFVVFAILIIFAAMRCEVHLQTVASGLRKGLPLALLFFPPAWKETGQMLQPLATTALMALCATIVGMCLSLPCAVAAASNLSPAPLRLTMRFLIAIERGLPEIVQMLLLVAIFGLGGVPGLIALSFSSVGMLAKLLADAIEEIEPSTLEAVAVVGATRSQVIRYAVIPQILPSLFANGLFRFEFNVRAGVILGAVGAGGIGYVMSTSMNAMDYSRACMATLLTLALVFAAERLSDFLRARILDGGQAR